MAQEGQQRKFLHNWDGQKRKFSPGDTKLAGRSGEDGGRAHMPWALYTLAEGLLAS